MNPEENARAQVLMEELEALLLKVDRFICADPELSEHTGKTVGALLMLAGGMLYTSDTSESFEVAEAKARTLLRFGFEHQKKAKAQ